MHLQNAFIPLRSIGMAKKANSNWKKKNIQEILFCILPMRSMHTKSQYVAIRFL